ncbi:MAG: methyltransferase domain-containing protein [Proteobacteria bacterium]|nr:MAG: methyltransferase domain-containing protein [Pseudomonadota bacterium]
MSSVDKARARAGRKRPFVQAGQALARRLQGAVLGGLDHVGGRQDDELHALLIAGVGLEHLPDPYSVLQDMKRFLAPNGRILVSLPNVRHIRNLFNLIVRKDWAYTDHGVLDRTHLRFFTLKSALRTFRDGGFEVETVQGIVSTKKWYMRPLNWLFLGYFEDTFHLQYAFRLKL